MQEWESLSYFHEAVFCSASAKAEMTRKNKKNDHSTQEQELVVSHQQLQKNNDTPVLESFSNINAGAKALAWS